MALSAGIGTSSHRNPDVAGHEAVARAITQLDGHADALLFFSTVGYDQQRLLSAAWREGGETPLSGCSVEGIIHGDLVDESLFAVLAIALRDPARRFRNGFVPGLAKDSAACARTFLETARRELGGIATAFAFPDGLTVNATHLQRELSGSGVPVFGGAAGECWDLERTWQYRDGEARCDGLSWMACAGGPPPRSALSQGISCFSGTSFVTKAEGRRLQEIDGLSVTRFFAQSLGGEEADWTNDALNIALAYEEDGDWPVTHLIARPEDLAQGVLVTQPELRPGAAVRLAHRNPESVREGIEELCGEFSRQLDGIRPALVLQFDCSGRGQVLFGAEALADNQRRLRARTPADVPWAGIFTYGELLPMGGRNRFHNYTAGTVALL